MSTLTAEDFDRVVRDEWYAFVKVAYRALNNYADAEEAVQNALIVAWEQRDTFDPSKGTLRGWIAGITRNRASVVNRTRSRYVPVGGWEDEHGFEFTDRRVEPTGMRCRRDDVVKKRIQAVMRLLPARERTALRLHVYSGMSIRQVSDRMGVTYKQACELLRQAWRRVETDPAIRRAAAIGPSPNELGVDSELAEAFRTRPELLAAIPERKREIIRLRYVDRLPASEVGRRLGIKTESVRRMTARARGAARKVLADLAGSGSAVTA